jgi:hypothetical protein
MIANNNQQIKSKSRVTDHGEVLTAEREVNAMLDLMKYEIERIDSRCLEPACGNGNFLAEILKRKLFKVKIQYGNNQNDYEKYSVLAVTSIYGVDILQDNIDDCISRLFNIFDKEYSDTFKTNVSDELRQTINYILRRNILCGDALTMKTVEGEPIIFSEWAFVTGDLVKRRDFRFDELLRGHQKDKDVFMQKWEYDDKIKTHIPTSVKDFPPIHYLQVQNYDRK